MKKTISILLILMMIFLSACASKSENALKQKVAEKSVDIAQEQAEEKAEEAARKASQQLVNFKCEVPGGQTIYFLKNKARVSTNYEGVSRNTWVDSEFAYTEMDINGKKYLLKVPSEESEIDYEDMTSTYQVYNSVPGYKCTLNTVKESDVAVPTNIETITNEQFAEKMSAGMYTGTN